MSHNGGLSPSQKSIYVDILMVFVFLVLVSFAIWLIWVTYFREHYDAGIIEFDYSKNGVVDVKSGIAVNSANMHFHNIEPVMESTETSPSACIVCHGSYPHMESKSTRAFLNAHAYVMACEVCHLNVNNSDDLKFRWLNTANNELADSRGPDGQYKIVPVSYTDGKARRYDELGDVGGAREYVKNQYKSTEAFKTKIIKKTHLDVADKATSCNECHNVEREPALLYKDLAYSRERIEELLRIEVAGMVHKYQNFYMPDLIQEPESIQ